MLKTFLAWLCAGLFVLVTPCAAQQAAIAIPSLTNAPTLASTLNSRIAAATTVSSAQGGVQWTGTYSCVIENNQTFAVF